MTECLLMKKKKNGLKTTANKGGIFYLLINKTEFLVRIRLSARMEHLTGIGPAYSAWEANILPLNHRCMLNIYSINRLRIQT